MTTKAPTNNRWSSNFSFVIAATAAAVGLGNIWKFPYIVGQNGGGAFVLVYLLFIFLIGVPVLMAEVLMGRRGRASPGYAVRKLAKESQVHSSWQITGWLGMFAGFMILSFYAVIAGWSLSYMVKAARGTFVGINEAGISKLFGSMVSSSSELMLYTTLIIVGTVVVVGKGFKSGLERSVTFLVPLLLVLLIIIAIYAAKIGDFDAAVSFLFKPDFGSLTKQGILLALGQSFFTLSLASGVMIIYGAYVPKETSIITTSIWIGIADTVAAVVAGLAIFPIVFGYGLQPAEGPGLIFQTLPIAFSAMPATSLVATIFFLMLSLAAFTSAIAMIEASVAFVEDKFNATRWTAAIVSGFTLWLVGLGTIYSFSGANWAKIDWVIFGEQLPTIFDAINHIASNILLPLGGLLAAIFTGWVMKKKFTQEELNTSPLAYFVWQVCVRYLAPVAIIAIFLQLLGFI
ncbi:sodium-dependent transporter [Aliidiomarina quisquiliarum]|uniref:sodium-dependent transporter n=1 Tax=Aliidiomarina quisquiliarum TaxID=2938947 RepID=UPI00208E6058|nr:sodium-dependent transporter [Aliidiomarina quisquiliarum]MCO4320753.1 sodium-dependent transporter [Aliidiomarina quisquiliarum]